MPDPRTLLRSLWARHPHLSRAVASMVSLLEAHEEVGELLEAQLPDLAARTLADSYSAKRAFQSVYGLPWRPACELLSRTCERASTEGGEAPGAAVLWLPAARMLEAMGYQDGLASDEPPATERTGQRGAESTSTQRRARDAGRLGARVLEPAYRLGHEMGAAERWLLDHRPDQLEAADREAPTGAGATEQTVVAWASRVASDHPAPLARYAAGRMRACRRRRARARLLELTTPAVPAEMGSALRVLGRASDEELGREGRALREEGVLMWACLGFDDEATAEMLDRWEGVPRAPDSIVRDESRDVRHGRRVRRVLRAVSGPRPGGRVPADPRAGLSDPPGAATDPPLADAGPEAVRMLCRDTPASETIERVREGAERLRGVANRQAAMLDLAGPEAAAALAAADRYVGATAPEPEELHPPSPTAPTLTTVTRDASRLARHIGRRLSTREAWRHLSHHAPRQADTVRAEVEIVRGGAITDLEHAEAWHRRYRQEARDGRGAQRTRSASATHVLDGALQERALREASDLLARHLPRVPGRVYRGDYTEEELARLAARALERARAEVRGAAKGCKAFVERLRQALEAVTVGWIAREREIAERILERPASDRRQAAPGKAS